MWWSMKNLHKLQYSMQNLFGKILLGKYFCKVSHSLTDKQARGLHFKLLEG